MNSVSFSTINFLIYYIQLVNLFKKPDCIITFDEIQGRHRHKLIDRNDKSDRYPTFFNGENISGRIEIKLNSKNLKHKGIKAELHGIIEKYGTIKKTKEFLNLSTDICRPEEITQEKTFLDFQFQNPKLPYESYKGDYASVKYFVRIIITATYKNAEYEKEFAVVNPYDSSILKQNDEPIRMQVGMKQKLSLSIFFQHKNYNCRGTLKGYILFNYINIPLTFMEVQIVRREVIFGDKKCEPAYVARYELIDGFPTKNERIPIRFFLKTYNLTPTYPKIENMFCVRYFLNLVIADEEHNRYFKQKEICLYRLYKERKNICKYNINFNDNYNYDENEYYNKDEIFITEPIYEEDFSLDYQPAFGEPNKKQNDNYNDNYEDDYQDNYEVKPNLPSINENESYDFGYDINNNINNNYNDGRNRNNNRNDRFNSNNRNNTFNNKRNNENNKINIINEKDNNYRNKNNINDNNDNKNNYNRNRTYNNKNDNNNIFNDNYIDDEDNNIINNNYNNRNKGNYFDENDNYINNNDNRNRKNNNKQNKININNNNNNKNKIIIKNPSNYHSISTNNNFNAYNEENMFNDDIDDEQNNIINTNSGNFRGNKNDINNNDIPPLENKSSHSHRNNLMQTRISNEEDFKNIFDSLDKNVNKEELKKNIFG